MYTVYKHTTPSNKVYIGITSRNPQKRWGNNGNNYKNNKHFWNAICKYGWDNITHEILYSNLDKEQACVLEVQLIKKYSSNNEKHGYNITEGGDGCHGRKLSDETKQKIRESALKRKPYKMTETWCKNMSLAKQGKKNPNYGKPMNEACKKALLESHSIPIYLINGEEKIRFENAKEAQRATGICAVNIRRVCNGERQTAGGFKWENV